MAQKLNIKRAAEFSFFLAVPTISAAAIFKLRHDFNNVTGENIDDLILGNVISFIVGMIAIRFFIGLITHYGLKFFGYYRIVIGACYTLIALWMGHKLEIPE